MAANPPMAAMGGIPSMAQIPPNQFYPPPPPQPYLEARIIEMNQRLLAFFHSRTNLCEADVIQWWDAFTHEFFDDNAAMTITTRDNIPDSRYCLNRTLIPRFFRSMVENGVTHLEFAPQNCQEFAAANGGPQMSIALSSEMVEVQMMLEKPVATKVSTVARFFMEFSPFDETFGYRIRNWVAELRPALETCQIPDEKLDPEVLRQKQNGLTICGLPIGVVMFLKMCMVLSPMQRLMGMCKQSNGHFTPQHALKAAVFHEYTRRQESNAAAVANGPPQPPVEEPQTKAKAPRKRTRKNANTNGTTGTTTNSKKSKANANAGAMNNGQGMPGISNPPPFSVNPNFNGMANYPHEVLTVSEPSMMGNEFGEADERAISRVENAQYDQLSMSNPNMMNNGSMMGSVPPHMLPHPPIINGSCK
ncbi:LIM interaction domain (LID) domain-containing protein [Aphelenchoides fujianensis]|nr:LIM interaction domain (LID) domain-containing protein [Aphelenchoides fujianensis]